MMFFIQNNFGLMEARIVMFIPTKKYNASCYPDFKLSDFTGAILYADLFGYFKEGKRVINGKWRYKLLPTQPGDVQIRCGGGGNDYPGDEDPVHLPAGIALVNSTVDFIDDCITICNGNCDYVLPYLGWGNPPTDGTSTTTGSSGSTSGGSTGITTGLPTNTFTGQNLENALNDLNSYNLFSPSDIDYLGNTNTKAALMLDRYLKQNSISDEAKATALLHLQLLQSDADYALRNINAPMIGTTEWANTLTVLDEGSPNAAEIALLLVYPRQGIIVKLNSNIAIAEAQAKASDSNFNDHNLHNGVPDAYRHGVWNALNAYLVGTSIAKQFADAHEWNSNNAKESDMDYFNNDVGRNIGANFAPSSNKDDLVTLVYNGIIQGKFKYFKPLGAGGVLLPESALYYTNQ